jgi:hypothetical protein
VAADAQVPGTPHTLPPPSPRRRTLRLSSGEFIRSWGGLADFRLIRFPAESNFRTSALPHFPHGSTTS